MDGSRFDEMTSRLSVAATRRRALGVVAGLLGGAVVAGEAAAGPASVPRQVCRPAGIGCTRDTQCCAGMCETGRLLPRTRRNRCACPEGLVGCGSQCVDTQTDVANCGACGAACASGESCLGGDCVSPIDCETYDGSRLDTAHICLQSTDEGGDVLAIGGSCSGYQPRDGEACVSNADCTAVLSTYPPQVVGICNTGYRPCTNPGPSCTDFVPYVGYQFCTYFYRPGSECVPPPQ